MMKINKAEFLLSVASIDKLPQDNISEIAISGKSNVGKSSFINFITGNSKLARASKQPGRTRLLNYFKINDGEFYFVDLPGYGYASVSDEEKKKWGILLDGYFKCSLSLKNVFVLLDIRRIPSEMDIQLVSFLQYNNIPFTIILTKADKLSRSQQGIYKQSVAGALRMGIDNLIVTSAEKKIGAIEVLNRIEQVISVVDIENDDLN